MFSINIYLKLAIIAVCIVGGIALAFAFGFWYAFPFFLIGIGFIVSYVMLGTVQSAAELMEAQDFDATEKRLNLTLTPKLLYVTNRAYYYILRGSIDMGRGNNEEAKEKFKLAKSLKLPSDNEKGLVRMQLAGIYAKNGNWNVVKKYMKEVKNLDITQTELKAQIAQFDKAMQQRGRNPQMMRQSKYFSKGGKRRRPKMR